MTLAELTAWLKQELGQAECMALLSHYLNISTETTYSQPDLPIEKDARYYALLEAVSRRVEKKIPLQYILGKAWFYAEEFIVTPDVLIPRPETELLVEEVLATFPDSPLDILDLATGSGCMAITLKKHRPLWRVTATDSSRAALAIAQQNADLHQTEIRFLHGHWFDPLANEAFDGIVCNPPYIDSADRTTLTPEVLSEPHQALFPPDSPQDLYRYLFNRLQFYLKPDSKAWFELGEGQSTWIKPLAESLGYRIYCIQDYQHIDRIAVLSKMLQYSPIGY